MLKLEWLLGLGSIDYIMNDSKNRISVKMNTIHTFLIPIILFSVFTLIAFAIGLYFISDGLQAGDGEPIIISWLVAAAMIVLIISMTRCYFVFDFTRKTMFFRKGLQQAGRAFKFSNIRSFQLRKDSVPRGKARKATIVLVLTLRCKSQVNGSLVHDIILDLRNEGDYRNSSKLLMGLFARAGVLSEDPFTDYDFRGFDL